MLKIVVLLKQTFDTEEKIVVRDGAIADDDVKFVINPYDEYALEEALLLREAHGGEIAVITYGEDRSEEALRTALALGADEAYRIEQDGLLEDNAVIAAALAQVIRPMKPDLVLAGLFAVDSGAGSVALQVAERLGIAHASAAVKVDIVPAGDPRLQELPHQAVAAEADGAPSALTAHAGRYALVERDAEGDVESVAVPLPALITAQQGLNEPRYPSLPGIMKAKRKPLNRIRVDDIFDAAAGFPQARTERTALFPPPPRSAGRRLTGSPGEQAAALAGLLRQDGVIGASEPTR
ncbi:electron transfer flavoprotein subunit beta/FixA family protein [Paenibacillus thailandensis]|uniref:Electron transfer flavoprotein subunit beta n=1 Tax=Paenibacillus thailandensis TaxID=393250 RepID=A0ABW5R0E9_9BACL